MDFFLCDVEISELGISFPGFFEFDHLLDWKLNFFIGRIAFLSYPINELLLLNHWLPIFRVPFVFIQLLIGDARSSTNEDNAWIVPVFYVDVAENKYIGISADKAFNGQITEFWLGMGGNLIMFGLNKMEGNVRGKTGFTLI